MHSGEPDERPNWTEVEHAGGVVRLRVPPNWVVGELAVGREIRLAFSPHPVADPVAVPSCWIAFHAQPQFPAVQLPDWFRQRLVALFPGCEPAGGIQPVTVGGFPGLRQVLRLPAGGTAQPAGGTAQAAAHVVVRTPAGLCEMHWRFEADGAGSQWETALVPTIGFSPPREDIAELPPDLAAAADVLGSWKSYGSRLRIYPDGRIMIAWDRTGPSAAESTVDDLFGHYTADGDILRVIWRDGSRLNLRWRRADHEMLLTDHEGHTSQLKRIYE